MAEVQSGAERSTAIGTVTICGFDYTARNLKYKRQPQKSIGPPIIHKPCAIEKSKMGRASFDL